MRGTLGARRINSPLQVKSRFSHADGATPPLLPCVAVSPDLASRHKWRGLRSGRGEFIRLAQAFQTTPPLTQPSRAPTPGVRPNPAGEGDTRCQANRPAPRPGSTEEPCGGDHPTA